MNNFYVRVAHEAILIDRRVFVALLNYPFILNYKSYELAIETGEIPLNELKELANKLSIPYPLFFAPLAKVREQIKNKDSYLSTKLSKSEIVVSARGSFQIGDIELIARDLGKKQEFLKTRLLPGTEDNVFVGLVARAIKCGTSNKTVAIAIREHLGIELSVIRHMSKGAVFEYLVDKAEQQGVLVSLSSHNYMPQNLSRDVELSGVCIKDKKFPYIFLNTRDGDDDPLILESDGRKILTLICMLVCISANRFVLNLKEGRSGTDLSRRIFAIAGEILIPEEDLAEVKVTSLDELREYSNYFKVTPSMLLIRLLRLGLISKPLAGLLKKQLDEALKSKDNGYRPPVSQVRGYGKYNGKRYSREVVTAQKEKRISREEANGALFKRRRVNTDLYNEYSDNYS